MLVRRTWQSATGEGAPVVVWYESPLLTAAGIPHAFSTRIGGVSPPPFDTLNLGNPGGCELQDSTPRIEQNYQILQSAFGLAGRPLLKLHQVHGRDVVAANPDVAWDGNAKGDAIVVGHFGPIASVRVADCVPILLGTQDGTAVAAVHAGWRGVVAGVATATLSCLRELRPNLPIVAAIGPCIGFESFEVGLEVLDCFELIFGKRIPIRRREDGKGYVDLRRALLVELTSAGVPPDRIDSTDRCTFRDSAEFFSHRRDDGVTGRMAALIATAR